MLRVCFNKALYEMRHYTDEPLVYFILPFLNPKVKALCVSAESLKWTVQNKVSFSYLRLLEVPLRASDSTVDLCQITHTFDQC